MTRAEIEKLIRDAGGTVERDTLYNSIQRIGTRITPQFQEEEFYGYSQQIRRHRFSNGNSAGCHPGDDRR
jgi:hypothetical protein